MKDISLHSQYAIKYLEDHNILEIPAICKEWMFKLEDDILEIYSNVIFKVEQVEDELYSLTIIL